MSGGYFRVITFGRDHRNPVTGESMGGKYIKVPLDVEKARAWVFARIGNAWAFDYGPVKGMQAVRRYSIQEVDTSDWPMLDRASNPQIPWEWVDRTLDALDRQGPDHE